MAESKRNFKYALTESDGRSSTPSLASVADRSDPVQVLAMTILSIKEIPNEACQGVVQWFKKYHNEKPVVNIVTIGKTGVGKSTLLNAIVGTKKFDEANKLCPGCSNVEECTVQIQGIEITVYDCPGLEDGKRNEEEYLRQLSEKCPLDQVDLMFFCIKMDETRKAGNTSAFEKVTTFLGKKIWEHAIVVLTFANMLIDGDVDTASADEIKFFEDKIQAWKIVVHEQLEKNGVERSVYLKKCKYNLLVITVNVIYQVANSG